MESSWWSECTLQLWSKRSCQSWNSSVSSSLSWSLLFVPMVLSFRCPNTRWGQSSCYLLAARSEYLSDAKWVGEFPVCFHRNWPELTPPPSLLFWFSFLFSNRSSSFPNLCLTIGKPNFARFSVFLNPSWNRTPNSSTKHRMEISQAWRNTKEGSRLRTRESSN